MSEQLSEWSEHCARMAKIGAVAAWRARENPDLVPADWVLVDRWGFWMPPEIALDMGWKFRSRQAQRGGE